MAIKTVDQLRDRIDFCQLLLGGMKDSVWMRESFIRISREVIFAADNFDEEELNYDAPPNVHNLSSVKLTDELIEIEATIINSY